MSIATVPSPVSIIPQKNLKEILDELVLNYTESKFDVSDNYVLLNIQFNHNDISVHADQFLNDYPKEALQRMNSHDSHFYLNKKNDQYSLKWAIPVKSLEAFFCEEIPPQIPQEIKSFFIYQELKKMIYCQNIIQLTKRLSPTKRTISLEKFNDFVSKIIPSRKFK